jgi:voltage-gated potassium channel
MNSSPRRSRLVVLGRPALTCLLVLAFYYVIPVEPGLTGGLLALRVTATAVTGVLITWLIVRQVAHHLADPERASLAGLLTALAGGVVFLALADFVIAVSAPGQFVGMETKTDALYFALSTLTTVGYGDIHAAGQIARGIVAVQLVFNVAVIASGASVLTRVFGARVREHTARLPR